MHMKKTPPAFRLPPDARTYVLAIVERCRDLIRCGIWGDLDIARFEAWLNNFSSHEERYFAACLLDHLIYRSKSQTISMLEQLFQRVLPDLTRLDPSPLGYAHDLLRSLASRRTDSGIRLVLAVKGVEQGIKSGNEIGRFAKRFLNFPERLFIPPSKIRSCAQRGIKFFVFIDDFLGTGTQFSKLLRAENIDRRLLSELYVVYAPLVSHSAGRQKLMKELPELRVRSVEALDSSYGLFDKDSACFNDECNTNDKAKEFYYELLRKKQLSFTRKLGYGQLELAYAFEHATPNNSLPILWYNGGKKWTPLFYR
jgi:hypothetical protein